MELVPFIWLVLIAAWIYSVFSLIYFPVKIFILKRKKKDVWQFLSRPRLLLSAFAYFVSAPLVGLLGFLVSAASSSGSHAVGMSDADEAVAWGLCAVFLAEATIALVLVFVRPKPPKQ